MRTTQLVTSSQGLPGYNALQELCTFIKKIRVIEFQLQKVEEGLSSAYVDS
jgi:hypothetical protein